MNDVGRQYAPAEISALYSMLNPSDVEQFYRDYQSWFIQQQISQLQIQLNTLQQQITENAARLQELHPSPIALAALAQLQAHGVNDIDVLDRMLERGEDWLDQTMQRLAYCEKFAIITDNYTEWCEHALDGAYDWIDSAQDGPSPSSADGEVYLSEVSAVDRSEQITEEMLLHKLMSDEAEVRGDISETWQDAPQLESAPQQAKPSETTIAPDDASSPGEQVAADAVQAQDEMIPPPPREAAQEIIPLEGSVEASMAEEIAKLEATPQVTPPPGRADSSADTAQRREQAQKPGTRPRKRGFFQRLFRLFRS